MSTRHALAFLVLLLAGPAVATAAAQEPAASPATVTSLGQATIRQPPDRVVITFETEVRGQSPQEAQARATTRCVDYASSFGTQWPTSVPRIDRLRSRH